MSLEPPAAREGAMETPAPSGQRSLRLLLAEDNPINARLVLLLLRKMGHCAELVEDGEQALEAVETRSFDAVLMDVQMPKLDGLEATRRIRAREREQGRARRIIVALTANAMRGDDDDCIAAGMDGYVSKPVTAATLRAALETYVVAALERAESP